MTIFRFPVLVEITQKLENYIKEYTFYLIYINIVTTYMEFYPTFHK